MFILISILFLGIVFGYLLRKKPLPVSQAITALVWLLLFLLGVEVGSNPQLVEGIVRLGTDAVVLSVLGTLGSLIAARMLWKYVQSSSKRS